MNQIRDIIMKWLTFISDVVAQNGTVKIFHQPVSSLHSTMKPGQLYSEPLSGK